MTFMKFRKPSFQLPLSWNLFGIPEPIKDDQQPLLREGQCIVKISNGEDCFFLSGPVCVFKSPIFHPGDLQIYDALPCSDSALADRFSLLDNCVVFPVVGTTPPCMHLSHADYDGDRYFVISNVKVIPTSNIPPFDYGALFDGIRKSRQANETLRISYSDLVNYWLHPRQESGRVIRAFLNFLCSTCYGPLSEQCICLIELFYKSLHGNLQDEEVELLENLEKESKLLPVDSTGIKVLEETIDAVPSAFFCRPNWVKLFFRELRADKEKMLDWLSKDDELKYLMPRSTWAQWISAHEI
ncbi:uncharacterized protein LOC135121943 isoform X2 [Zophobas morio]|jgi:hypothetical protein|uniref:uncharacterized protein LOC135121943 isoform X2 n=1 Tax=Zophobas morio TaxID=2755281 RepID=UPI003082C57F